MEDIHRKIGQRKRKIIIIGAIQIRKLGYFLLTIENNLIFSKKTNKMQFPITRAACVFLEIMILGYRKGHIIEIIIIQI